MMKDFTSLLIKEGASIKKAMEQLELSAKKILFVVKGDLKLIGSLTDGDIRRWILKGGTLEEPVEKACFRGTFFTKNNYDPEEIRNIILKNKFEYVPVVDEQQRIYEFLAWDKLFDGALKRKVMDKLDMAVVIMAGGEGTRMIPFTQILPKPLIPLGEKSVIETIIDRFLEYDASEFHITVNYRAKIIKAYFEYLKTPYSLSFIDESIPRGTAGCLQELAGKMVNSFFVTNCDVIVTADYSDIKKFHYKNGFDITLIASVKQFRIPYGICKIEKGLLTGIDEKPELNFLVNTGMYILKPEVLKLIPAEGTFHMTHLIKAVQAQGGRIGVYPVGENSWVDVGEWSEYKRALDKIQL